MEKPSPKYLVSACLCGIACRYDGSGQEIKEITKLYELGQAVLICPECLGGLKTPRPPAEIIKGKVIDSNGKDLSAEFIKGAECVLDIALKYGITTAILKERSPSCASTTIYDGTFSNKQISGQGITTQLLRKNNIKVISEEDFLAS